MPIVETTNLTKTFSNGTTALSELTLAVAEGELLVLLGPSGCGKTTTLRLLAGLEEPTSGSIRLYGRDMQGVPPRKRDVAMVFQRPAIYPHLNVKKNLAFGAKLRGKRSESKSLDERVRGAADLLGLANVLDRKPAELSGGQQQRVALGRALVRQAGLYLLDEPLASLDLPLRTELRRELHLIQRRLRATMIFVTHDQVEAMTLGDRLVVLDRGVVQQIGPPAELYQRPSNRFVAGFLGWPAMNLLDGELVSLQNRLCFRSTGLELPIAVGFPVEGNRRVTLGIRPEDVSLSPSGPASVSVTMIVALAESLGGNMLVTLASGTWRLQSLSQQRPAEGETVEVYLNMAKAQFFDANTGVALTG